MTLQQPCGTYSRTLLGYQEDRGHPYWNLLDPRNFSPMPPEKPERQQGQRPRRRSRFAPPPLTDSHLPVPALPQSRVSREHSIAMSSARVDDQGPAAQPLPTAPSQTSYTGIRRRSSRETENAWTQGVSQRRRCQGTHLLHHPKTPQITTGRLLWSDPQD